MGFWKVILSIVANRRPTVNQLDHETIAKNIKTGELTWMREPTPGAKEVVSIMPSLVGTSDPHVRAHQIDSIEDHPPVPEAKRDKWLHSNAVTGAIELIDLPESLDGLTPFIGENGNWWIGEEDTGVKAAGEDGDDGISPHIGVNGNWWIGAVDTGVKAAGTDGEDGEDGINSFVYIAYASDASGADWNLTPSATLKYRAEIQSTIALTPVESDFAAATWVKYIGDDGGAGDLGHYCYIAWRDAPGTGFTMEPNLTLDYEAILITHTEIAEPVEADFEGFWRQRVTPSNLHGLPAGGTIGQVFKKLSNDDYDAGWQNETQLIAIPAVNKTASGTTVQFTANENQLFGDVVRINSAGKAQLAKADVIANANALAICIGDVLANATGNYLLIGFIRDDSWNWTVGGKEATIYLSLSGTTGNTLTQTNPADDAAVVSDNVVQILGIANSADSFYFNPSLSQVEYKV